MTQPDEPQIPVQPPEAISRQPVQPGLAPLDFALGRAEVVGGPSYTLLGVSSVNGSWQFFLEDAQVDWLLENLGKARDTKRSGLQIAPAGALPPDALRRR